MSEFFHGISEFFNAQIPHALAAIVLLPIAGALLNAIGGRRADKQIVTIIAVGSVMLAFALAALSFGHLVGSDEHHRVLTDDVYEWFSISINGTQVPVRVRFVMDELSGIMTVMVTGIAMLIHIYSVGYMHDDEGYARFMAYLNLFTASMLVLVLASNIPLMFVGWEGVGLCSYLLIGFWFTNREYAAAGRKAFVMNRIGDFGVLIGTFLIVTTIASPEHPDAFEFSTISSQTIELATSTVDIWPTAFGWTPPLVATVAALCLFLGCTGKSAQIPLFTWLPDAMAGPTPVSALIHAATMVTAGVYLCCRMSPLFVESSFAMSVIAITGAVTALFAASIALVQNQMKRILAYSTVSQLGFMFAAVGTGAFAGGIFHVFTHAFFKACLFLGAGSVMHAVHAHGDADVRYLGGLRKYMPRTHTTFLISCAAIAGLPVFSGFFSKDEILTGAATWGMESTYASWVGWLVFAILVLAATMTAFYMFRLYFLTFHGKFKGGHPLEPGEHHDDIHDPHESPDSMTVPLMVLAGGAAIVGLLALPHWMGLPNLWSEWLTPRYEAFSEGFNEAVAHGASVDDATNAGMQATSGVREVVATMHVSGLSTLVHTPLLAGILALVFGLLAGIGGTALAYVLYVQQEGALPRKLAQSLSPVHRLLLNKWYIDELYSTVIVAPVKFLGVFAANLDNLVVDGLLTKVTSWIVRGSGWLVTRAQTGTVYVYASIFAIGLAGMGWWFTFPHASFAKTDTNTDGTVDSRDGSPEQLELVAAPGLGYEYRWDFDGDGHFDTDWSSEPRATHQFRRSTRGQPGDAFYVLAAVIDSPIPEQPPVELPLVPGIQLPLPLELVAQMSAPPEQAPTIEYIRAEHHEARMRVRGNGAVVSGGDAVAGEEGVFDIEPGERVSIGDAQLRLAILMHSTVEVRNSFGNLSRSSQYVTMHIDPNAAHADLAHGVMP